MSGGHYEYAYWRMVELAERIERDLAADGEAIPGLSKDMRGAMKRLCKQLRQVSKRARALEWFMSGDTTEQSALEALKVSRGKK